MKPIHWVMLGAAMANTKVLSQIKPERFAGNVKGTLEAMKAKKAIAEKVVVDGVEVVSCPPVDLLLDELHSGSVLHENENVMGAVVRIWESIGAVEQMTSMVQRVEGILQRVKLSGRISTYEQHKAELAKLADELAKLTKE